MQRKKKRSIIFELHSIPIKIRSLWTNTRKNFIFSKSPRISKRLYLVSYSIPLSCMIVLLLGFEMMINPNLSVHNKSYALENDSSSRINVSHPEISMTVSKDTGDGYGNDATGQVETAPGAGTAYRSHKINITGTDIRDYQLSISGPTNLTSSSGASTIVGGAGGKTGSNMDGNTWGYAWGDIADEVTSMTYNTMAEAGNNLACTNPKTDYTVDCEKKLVFGANFATGADNGTYTAEVTVSLTATPYLVGQAWTNESGFSLDTGIDDMQDVDKVDGGFCNKDIPAGSTVTLRDARGGVENLYKIIKMLDGTCWMAENLRLKSNTKITPADSDVASDYTLPDSNVKGNTVTWGNNYNAAYMADGATNMTFATVNGDWKEAYGNYYSWCVATAMSCLEDTNGTTRTGSAFIDKDAQESICPKGWKLPAGTTGVGSFQNLYNTYPNSMSDTYWLTNQPVSYNGGTSTAGIGYNGKRFGKDSTDALFLAAGLVNSSGLNYASTTGYYWSRTAGYSVDYARRFNFGSSFLDPQYNASRYDGSAVRCVYDEHIGDWQTPSGQIIPTGLQTMQSITKSNFTTKYCAYGSDDTVPVGSTIKLLDARDNNLYTIVRLPDGNSGSCWMQDNLALNGSRTLTSSDSDVTSNWTLPASVTDSWATGDSSNQAIQMKNGTPDMVIGHDKGDGQGWQPSYGNYYSWNAATAGTGGSITSGQARSSICPKGWKLPTGGESGQFYELLKDPLQSGTAAAFSAMLAAPYKFVTAGYIEDSSAQLSSPGRYGYYWSRTPYSATSAAYDLYLSASYIDPQRTNYHRYSGFSVRCVAEPAS